MSKSFKGHKAYSIALLHLMMIDALLIQRETESKELKEEIKICNTRKSHQIQEESHLWAADLIVIFIYIFWYFASIYIYLFTDNIVAAKDTKQSFIVSQVQ